MCILWKSVSALSALRSRVIKSKGVTMTALLAKATALALAKHSVVNSSCRDGNSFTYNNNINIAVAVAIDGGLITPVLQDADKTFHEQIGGLVDTLLEIQIEAEVTNVKS